MKTNKIFFRANGNSQIGLGHIIRSISLIQMIENKFNCVLIVNIDIPREILPKSLKCIFIETNNLSGEFRLLNKYLDSKSILILDGYNFDINYQIKIKPLVKNLIVIDDYKNHNYNCDVLINHGISSSVKKHNIQTCFGFEYLILRNEFLKAIKNKNTKCKNRNIFVCFGGSDPYNITNKVLKALRYLPKIDKIYVVLGAANKWKDELIEKFACEKINFHINSSALEMVKMLNNSSVGISTSSTIALEICSTHTPVICGRINSNQKCIDNYIVSENCGISIGNWNRVSISNIKAVVNEMFNPNLQALITYHQSNKIDGHSKKRFLKLFNSLLNE